MKDYQKHIKDTLNSVNGGIQISYCGEYLNFDWHFVDIDHAVQNTMKGGRLQTCPKCAKEIIKILQNENSNNIPEK